MYFKTVFDRYRPIIQKQTRLSLSDERRLIRRAKKGDSRAQNTLLLHLVGYFIYRIRTQLFSSILLEYGEDILQECLLWTPKKIQSYNLRYRNQQGIFQPVYLRSYIWKGITGIILQYINQQKTQRFDRPFPR